MNSVLRPEEVAELLQCSKKTVIKLAKAGSLPAFRLGDLWRFSAEAVHRFIATNGGQGEQAA